MGMKSKVALLLAAGMILFGCVPPNSPVIAAPTADIETIGEFFARCPTVDEVSRVNADLILHFDYDPTRAVQF
jgi:hypothetical protein